MNRFNKIGSELMDIREKFPRLFAENKDMYYRIAFSFMKNEDEAIDAVCEMSLKAWEKLSWLRKEEAFRSWSTSILVNVCKTRLKKAKRETVLYEREPAVQDDTDELLSVHQAVDKLPMKLKEVVILRYFNGFELSMISDTLQIPLGTVKSRLNRAIAALEKELGENNE